MVTIPAPVWRYGFAVRAVVLGGSAGGCLGVLAWLDSGFWITGVIVLVVVGAFYGTWMARRMTKYWPNSVELSGGERVAVVDAARSGEPVGDERLAQSVAAYARGLHTAAGDSRMLRWVVAVVLVVAIGTAVWDGFFGSWGNLIASAVYLAALLVEVFWWPRRQRDLLANADRAAAQSH
ncbi:hypothetical protein [Mycobacterium sp. 236(2023)]|uniref:hypothetical protein n=1 Tax=Mycobacterium sp. 236(2023) TaxID=3038163 RepID=UPI002414E995|nr:hypothetical protein [Mycobacterium sp. 236(2023)]MDG4668987.1 hypothetical protein [Mycobacterium sp. 236(2023)]